MSSARDVAQWMVDTVRTDEELYQDDAVDETEQRLGSEFVYDNENGNPAIEAGVLSIFRQLTLT